MTDSALQELAAILRDTEGLVLVVTGAGTSLASGIPTFRGTDKDAVWDRDVQELGTYGFFRENPAGSWQWYLQRFERVRGALPNPAHHALVELERRRAARGQAFLLVTQNIDTLHAQAGSQQLVEVHGSAAYVRCATDGCVWGAPYGVIARTDIDMTAFERDPVLANVPTCPACGDYLRQHVLWFDETYDEHQSYQWPRVLSAALEMEALVFVGTSFAVGVTDLLVSLARQRGVPAFSIDPGGRVPAGVRGIPLAAEVALPRLVGIL